ncbi:hypothetical protein QZM97_23755 [Burkholderia orbicola]|uniref:hypothetical protein n=1 Tax=Burkholderia orbicola TaxID=2978683 RepID=UPI002655FA84|nr:hypothetical protein [Burkholderia orbicola]MDN7993094.1 hypothetical protein [Burkholderia orbicola]
MNGDIRNGYRLAWGTWMSPDDIYRLRFELAGLIDQLADEERWPLDRRAAAMCSAMRGPLADLLPNLHHFRERMQEVFAERDARRLIASSMQRRGAGR